MDDQLWNLFRETGEPMGYLLYRAEKKQTQEKKMDRAMQGGRCQKAGRDDPGAPKTQADGCGAPGGRALQA